MIDDFLYGTAGHTGALTEVEAAVRAAAAAEIMPRHRKLAAHEIIEKSGPHDLVTAATGWQRNTSPPPGRPDASCCPAASSPAEGRSRTRQSPRVRVLHAAPSPARDPAVWTTPLGGGRPRAWIVGARWTMATAARLLNQPPGAVREAGAQRRCAAPPMWLPSTVPTPMAAVVTNASTA
ncbi:hypothetical protein SMICM304S_03930 [Streptomyces microflavus]